MNTSFKQIFDELELQREQLFAMLKDVPEERYNTSPHPDKWSISQIVTHLLTSEKLSLAYMKKKALGIDAVKNSGFTETLRLGLLILSQRIPAKYKAPKVVTENTPPALGFPTLVDEWSALRHELNQFLEGIEDRHVRKVLYKHPLAGRLDVRQAMIFFREHINHHRPQIERLL